MKFVKKFETEQQFNNFTLDENNTPNVSLIEELYATGGIVYTNQIIPQTQHAYVEIGGIKWATMNIGANSITDGGLYFQWGDTQGYTETQVGTDKTFDFSDYKWTNDNGSTFTKYNATDNKLTLDISDDAVNAAWGGNWRMPTINEYSTLAEAANCIFTEDYQGSGVSGIIFTDKTDNAKTLFLPFVGSVFSNNPNQINDSYSYYWTSTSAAECGIEWAQTVQFTEDDYDENNNMLMNVENCPNTRASGYVIRGILDE